MRPTALEAWHALVAARHPAGLEALLAADAVFHSPVVHAPQVGRPLVARYLAAALEVLGQGDFRYVREIVGPHDALLEFEVELDGVVVNGVDLLRWNDAGQIVDFKVMLRPMRAIEYVRAAMAAKLGAAR
ncbi:MAG: nuclear transport factor 2 family protein [Proteobacteria bacterium]|nr:nuclear transport factor 2 family protein [Pseudomonadota bacterium]